MIDLMVRPPTTGQCSEQTIKQYNKEVEFQLKLLKSKAATMDNKLNSMKNIKSNETEAGYYAFPRIEFPKQFLNEAKSKEMDPSTLYCSLVLQTAGVALTPSQLNNENSNSHHFVCSILGDSSSTFDDNISKWDSFNEQFMNKYK